MMTSTIVEPVALPRLIRRLIVVASLLLFSILAYPVSGSGTETQSYRDALLLVEQAIRSHGGLLPIEQAGGIVIRTEGIFDLTARLQGRSPDRPEPTPINETISIDLAGNRVAVDYEWNNYVFSRQHLVEIYDAQGRVLYLDKRAGNGGYPPMALLPDAKERYRRILPHFMLADALANRATLRMLGGVDFEGVPTRSVGYVTSAGDHLTLYFSEPGHFLVGAAHVFDMELLGDTEIRWVWSDYSSARGLQIPGRLRTFLAGRLMKDVIMSVAVAGPESKAFRAPESFKVGPPPSVDELRRLDEFIPYSQRESDVQEIHDGVFLARNIRPGFHMLFIEFRDFVLAVDAPTGWYEMNQIPPFDFTHETSTTNLSEKYIRVINATVPGKPVRYVVLSHHHSDHIGGLRAFVADGARIIAAEPAAEMAKRSIEREFSLAGDLLSPGESVPSIESVSRNHVVSDGDREIHLIELPDGNPKADGFLVVYVPDRQILYFTGFIYPVPEEAFPVIESVPLSLWFVRWLDRSGLEVREMYNVHGAGQIEDWQLDRLRAMLQSGEFEVAGSD